VEIELLGPPAVRHGQQRPKVPGRQAALLAALALAAPRPVTADRLIEAIWADDVPADPANALQQRISALRKLVDPDRSGDVLVATPQGYLLRVDDEHIDARRFEQLAARGRQLLATGDLHGAERDLVAGLGLWRGPALDGCADEPWARAEAGRLDELRLAAIEDRIDTQLRLGAGTSLIGELTELCDGHPTRERLRGQLMLALARGGRQVEALQVYDRTREVLADELGIDPGPELQRIHLQVLTQDVTAAPAAGGGVPAAGNLPAASTRLIGREAALQRLDAAMAQSRLVTLVGSGGAGKTSLALEAARRSTPPSGGSWLVELAPVADPMAVPATVAAALGVEVGGFGVSGPDPGTIATALAAQARLIVLDNCEHLVDSVRPLVERLLAAAPEIRIVATSRGSLDVPGEAIWPVPPLDVPATTATTAAEVLTSTAAQLLVERARAQVPAFELTDATAPAATRLLRSLDGVPLAIELAASRLRVLSMEQVADGLEDRFALLARRGGAVPARQRSMRGALDWSWDLLDVEQRTAWMALAVPAGPFGFGFAAQLLDAAGIGEPLDRIADLVDRSLVVADTSATPARYRVLETIRAYGRERLAATELDRVVRARHADLVEAGLAEARTSNEPSRFGLDLDVLTGWLDEARTALAWAHSVGDRGRVQRVAAELGWVWMLRGQAREGLGWLDRGLGPVGAIDAEQVDPAAVLWAAALRAIGPGDADAERWAQLAVQVARTPADHAIASIHAAVQRANGGQLGEGLTALDACAAEARAIGGWPLGYWYLIRAQLSRIGGLMAEVADDAETALGLLVDDEVGFARVLALDIVIDEVTGRGDYERAEVLATEGLRLSQRQHLPELEARMLVQLALVVHERGDPERASRSVAHALRLLQGRGSPISLGFALLVAGSLARHRGDLDLARAHLDAAADLLSAAHAAFGTALAEVERLHLAVLAGDGAEAAARSVRLLAAVAPSGEPELRVMVLCAVAGAEAIAGDAARGVELLATADAIREVAGVPFPPPERRDAERVATLLRSALGEADFDAGFSETRTRVLADPEAAVAVLDAADPTADAPTRGDP
jgi:predicted ATPase/DNA-binding SARP family transcriptional activator